MTDLTTDGRYVFNRNGHGTHQAITEMVRPGSRVLDVGCAAGYLLLHLQSVHGCRVAGIEPDAEAAALARAQGLEVREGLFDEDVVDELVAGGESFDHVVFADVLEHMPAPEPVLRATRRLLAPGGSVLVSLPNIGFGPARLKVAAGVFEYRDSGIFDRTHLRFFTVRTGRRLLEDNGFEITAAQYVGPLTHRGGRWGLKVNALRPQVLSNQMVLQGCPGA